MAVDFVQMQKGEPMADLIERQEAIDAIEHITSSMSVCINTDECHGMKRMQRQAVIELANLPSAQPEIIRCCKCGFWDRDTLRHQFNDFRDWNEAECMALAERDPYHEIDRYTEADDFCSYAERRTE